MPYLADVTGRELKRIREAFGLSASAMGRALGYSGPKPNMAVHVRRLERDARRIPPTVEKLALMYARHGIPGEWWR
jgi:transcriptional regulator with XRE-family HTH domain